MEIQEKNVSDDLSDVILYALNHFADFILACYVHRLCEVVISRDDTKSHVGNISFVRQLKWKGKGHEGAMEEPALFLIVTGSCHKVKLS